MTATDLKVKALIAAQRMTLRQAAPYLAANGWPVYPCVEAGKTPLVPHGLLEATMDARQVERWWSRWPTANIATPTGQASGFDVVDVDVRDQGSGYGAFHRAADKLGCHDWALRVLTPSGGMHFYYPCELGRSQANWVCAKAHVDFRGAGGAIILPPSEGACGHDIRQPYTLVATQAESEPIDSKALRDFLDPEWAKRRFEARLRRTPEGTAHTNALQAWVATRPEGERNAGLFWAACRMAEAGHQYNTTLAALLNAAHHCGLLDREILATVNSAYRHSQPATTATPEEPSRSFPARRQAVMAL